MRIPAGHANLACTLVEGSRSERLGFVQPLERAVAVQWWWLGALVLLLVALGAL